MTIDRLYMAKIKHLQHIHDLGSYRNACRVVNELKPYIHEAFHAKEKVVYLNQEGRGLIDSEHEVKKTNSMEHTLLRNEVYIYHNCPRDWRNECTLEYEDKPNRQVDYVVNGLKPYKKKVICDALYNRNGYTYLVEVDNIRDMRDNRKKVESYAEILPYIRGKLEGSPVVCFYTTTQDRKKKLSALLKSKSIHHEARTFDEIK
jgi:hypothetical protein